MKPCVQQFVCLLSSRPVAIASRLRYYIPSCRAKTYCIFSFVCTPLYITRLVCLRPMVASRAARDEENARNSKQKSKVDKDDVPLKLSVRYHSDNAFLQLFLLICRKPVLYYGADEMLFVICARCLATD